MLSGASHALARPKAEHTGPKAEHAVLVSGTVIDSEGKRVQGARVDYARPDNQPESVVRSDSKGHFAVETTAKALVVRKAGFDGTFVSVSRKRRVKVVLRHSVSPSVKACSAQVRCQQVDGWATSLCIPEAVGVPVTAERGDSYAVLRFSWKSSPGSPSLVHGVGPTWTVGLPSEQDVWQSEHYSEATVRRGFLELTDARGKRKHGGYWRYIGLPGESAGYRDVSAVEAQRLNQALDSICVRSEAFQLSYILRNAQFSF
jgi:hypothetical protein